ncbi:MAG TPA: YciI family protein [Saprospiraceae bacterium]|nr:YciI family protein [Saprospiraceae bacterium]HPN69661.1 YciI family protein [Saprospiraceae bacterium]
MKKFLLLLHEDFEVLENLSPKEMEELTKSHFEWAQLLTEKGFFLSGDGLEAGGKLIKGKESTIKDGPYMESKEMIGGYYLLQADSLEEVLEIAKSCPCHHWGGTTEVRAIMDYEE